MKIIKIILILCLDDYHARSALPIFNVYQGCFLLDNKEVMVRKGHVTSGQCFINFCDTVLSKCPHPKPSHYFGVRKVTEFTPGIILKITGIEDPEIINIVLYHFCPAYRIYLNNLSNTSIFKSQTDQVVSKPSRTWFPHLEQRVTYLDSVQNLVYLHFLIIAGSLVDKK